MYASTRFSIAALLLLLLAAPSSSGQDFAPEAGAVDASPHFTPGWKDAVHSRIASNLRARDPKAVKIVFLGEPVSAMLRGSGTSPSRSGYGGLMAVRRKSVLTLEQSWIYFYLVDSGGALITFRDIEDMNANDTMPDFLRVRVNSGMVREDNPYYWPEQYDQNGFPIPGTGSKGQDEHRWATHEEKVVEPVLDAANRQRLDAFKKTSFSRLPVCQ